MSARSESPTAPLRDVWLVAALGFAVRGWLILRYPAVFGDDAVMRLAYPEHVLLAHSLPLPQLAVHLLNALVPGAAAVRWFMALCGSAAGVAFYLFAVRMVRRRDALPGALLFSVSPFVAPLSTVPYQEIFMVGGVLLAFWAILADRPVTASLALAVACFARYESWLACPIVAAIHVARRGISPRSVVTACLLYGWAPGAWIIAHQGVSPSATITVESHVTAARLFRWVDLGYTTVLYTPLPVLGLTLAGIVATLRRRQWRETPSAMLLGLLALFLIAILFSAHGVAPDPELRVTWREAHLPIVTASLLATAGLVTVRRLRGALVVLGVVWSVWQADRLVARLTAEPRVALSLAAARHLDSVVQPGEHVVVLARPLGSVDRYLSRSARDGRRGERQAALRILDQVATPPGYQRILVHSRLGKSRLHTYSSVLSRTNAASEVIVARPVQPADPRWVAQWDDFEPTSAAESTLAVRLSGLRPEWSAHRNGARVAVYRLGELTIP